jgi:hypothetical protein
MCGEFRRYSELWGNHRAMTNRAESPPSRTGDAEDFRSEYGPMNSYISLFDSRNQLLKSSVLSLLVLANRDITIPKPATCILLTESVPCGCYSRLWLPGDIQAVILKL